MVSQLRDHIQDLQNELHNMKTSHKKEGAEDLAKIVEAEEIKEKDRAIYGKKMTTMLTMIVDLNKPNRLGLGNPNPTHCLVILDDCTSDVNMHQMKGFVLELPHQFQGEGSNFVVNDSEISFPRPFLVEEFP